MNPLIVKLEQRDHVSDEERAVLEAAISTTLAFDADQHLVEQGDEPTSSLLMLEGLSYRFKSFPDGRRQISAIHIPGDFVDLHSFLLRPLDHGICALTPCRVAVTPHARLKVITETQPHLTRLLWLSTLMDAANHREWLAAHGQRSPEAQVCHLLCEIYTRMQIVGLAPEPAFYIPLTQEELGDVLGLSTIHVNRTLKRVRAQGCVRWVRGQVTISDFEQLKRIAEFETDYLYLRREPR